MSGERHVAFRPTICPMNVTLARGWPPADTNSARGPRRPSTRGGGSSTRSSIGCATAPAERIVIDGIARHGRGGPLDGVRDLRLARGTVRRGRSRRPGSRSGYASLVDAKHQPDARDHLRAGFRASSEMLAADRDIDRALRSMAQLDEQAVGGVVPDGRGARAAGMARLAGRLARAGVLLPNVQPRRRRSASLWVLTSFESFDLLYTGPGPVDRRVTEILRRHRRARPLHGLAQATAAAVALGVGWRRSAG